MNLSKNRMIHILIATLLISCVCLGQEQDVPAVVTASGQFDRMVVVRLKQHTDLLGGLKEAVQQEKINNAVILSGIGSLTSHHLHVVDNNTFPTENVFFKDSIPVDLTSVNGYVFNGKVHAHINISDENMAIGGHLEPGTTVFTFAIITIGVFDKDVNLDRFDDKYWK
jgi:predicted DNA-binding protein with PD1-like motif